MIGKSQHRFDTDAKIKGKEIYGIDVYLPQMKTGYIVGSSFHDDKILYLDDCLTLQVQGVHQVLKKENIICIVADNYWTALQGAKQLIIKWESDRNSSINTVKIYQNLKDAINKSSTILYHNNNYLVQNSLKKSKKHYHWNYLQPMLLHAALEPINCTIFFHDNQCELWIGSQAPLKLKEQFANQFHLDKNNIILHFNAIGGSFGRRLDQQYILQAAEFAKHVSHPLKCMWSRETDFQSDTLRPPYYDQIDIGVDDKYHIQAVHHKMVTFVSSKNKNNPLNPDYLLGLDTMPYQIENYQFEYVVCDDSQLTFGLSQGREATRNIFVLENSINRLAFHAQKDPIDYRISFLSDNRAIAVLNLLIQNLEWGKIKSKNIRQGFAMAHIFGSHIAMVIEAEITTTFIIRLHRVDVAIDCGLIINPDQVRAQIESSVIFGLSDALYGEVQIEKGQVQQRNYNQYRVLRMNDIPKINIHFIKSNEPPSAVGELGTVVAAPALAHALELIQGKFLESLPLAKQIFQHK